MLNTDQILIMLNKDLKKIKKKIEDYEKTIEDLYKQKKNLEDQIKEWEEFQQTLRGPGEAGPGPGLE